MEVFTIGYEGMDLNAFLNVLDEHDIETLVDVRELPLSRKPGFSKKSLSAALGAVGVGYVHMVALGCPKSVRDQHRRDGDWSRYVEGFLSHLTKQGQAIVELSELAGSSRCALMCFEADSRFCHRSMVAASVSRRCGAKVRHIEFGDVRTAQPATHAELAVEVGRSG